MGKNFISLLYKKNLNEVFACCLKNTNSSKKLEFSNIIHYSLLLNFYNGRTKIFFNMTVLNSSLISLKKKTGKKNGKKKREKKTGKKIGKKNREKKS